MSLLKPSPALSPDYSGEGGMQRPFGLGYNSFLEGPNSRGRELWFTLSVLMQFIKGFRKLHFIGPCITVFGSARIKENDPYYQLGTHVGRW